MSRDVELLDLLSTLDPDDVESLIDDLPEPVAAALLQHLDAQAERVRWVPDTPLDLAVHLDPGTIRTPALELISQRLVETVNKPNGRLIISMPPQEGKSVLASRRFPLWLLLRDRSTRVALASYESGIARRWGRAVRDDIEVHPDLGLLVKDEVAAQHEWEISEHQGGMYSVGIGSALTGRSVDVLIIDDPLKDREQADSATYRQRAWDWWLDVGATRLAPGAPVVLIMTRWHEDDLAGRLLDAVDGSLWDVVNIPAQADKPNDPLRRDIGEYLTSARGRTPEDWAAIKLRSGSRTWASLYQGSPAPEEGAIFNPRWWQFWETEPSVDRVLTSWDCAFKGTESSDFVVGQKWGIKGADRFLLDQVRGRWTFTETLAHMRSFCSGVRENIVEDKANGTAVIDTLRHEIPGMIGVNPTNSKEARAHSVTPQVEAGNVYLPKPSAQHAWVDGLLTELQQFPSGAHDDQCLMGATEVLTSEGVRRLDEVCVGDQVLGASGWVDVLEAGCTGRDVPLIASVGLVGTASHPVWTERGWVPLADVAYDDVLWTLCARRDAEDRLLPVGGVCRAGNAGIARGDLTADPHPYADASRNGASSAVLRSGAMPSYAETAGALAETLRWWSPMASPSDATQMRGNRHTSDTSSLVEEMPRGGLSRYIERSTNERLGRSQTGITSTTATTTQPTTALTTLSPSLRGSTWGGTGTTCGKTETRCSPTLNGYVLQPHSGIVLRRVDSGTVSTPSAPASGDVFNLTTSDGTFFADGVLVHNCDALTQALSRVGTLAAPARVARPTGSLPR